MPDARDPIWSMHMPHQQHATEDRGEAADGSGIVAEMLKSGGEGWFGMITDVFNDVLFSDVEPETWWKTKMKVLSREEILKYLQTTDRLPSCRFYTKSSAA